MMRVGTLFTNEVVVAGPQHSIGWVAGLMEQHNVGSIVIVDQQRPVGIVTDAGWPALRPAPVVRTEGRVCLPGPPDPRPQRHSRKAVLC
jgi:hypothetical protein